MDVLHSSDRTEKNATPWSKDKLKSLLEGLVIEDDKCKLWPLCYLCELYS